MLGIQLKTDLNRRLTRNVPQSFPAVDAVNVDDFFSDSAFVDGLKYSEIGDGEVQSGMLADAAVTTAAIANLAIDTSKLANLAVEASKIANSAVESTKIANAAVGSAAIANLAVGTAHIANGAILTAKIGDAQITNAKINDLSADKITAGTITGRELRSSSLDGSSGSGVKISSGNNAPIRFYYNGTERATIDGYTTEGSEVSYLRLVAGSGRRITFKNSFIEVNGNFNPNNDDDHYVGTSGTRWARMYAGRFYQKDSGDGETCFGFGYVEMGLLSEKMREKYLETDEHGNRPIDRVPEESIRLPYPLGTVMVYKRSGLRKSNKVDDIDVVAVANKRGLPIIVGADPVLVKGKVKKGDIIVSGKNGVGVVKNDGQYPIGRALEDKKTNGVGLVKTIIRFSATMK